MITGADRIAANGDTANKIGTYASPCWPTPTGFRFTWRPPAARSTWNWPSGDQIPIEQRDPREVTHGFGRQTAPTGSTSTIPAFDVTPARLITAIVTERGVIEPVDAPTIRRMLA